MINVRSDSYGSLHPAKGKRFCQFGLERGVLDSGLGERFCVSLRACVCVCVCVLLRVWMWVYANVFLHERERVCVSLCMCMGVSGARCECECPRFSCVSVNVFV